MKKTNFAVCLILCFVLALSFAFTACDAGKAGKTPGETVSTDSGSDRNPDKTGSKIYNAPETLMDALDGDFSAYMKDAEKNDYPTEGNVVIELNGNSVYSAFVNQNEFTDIGSYSVSKEGALLKAQIESEQNALKNRISAGGITAEYKYGFNLLINAVTAKVAYSDLLKISELPGVKAVHISERFTPAETSVKSDLTGGVGAEQTISASSDGGEGAFVAILDTAIDPSHPAFSPDELKEESKAVNEYQIGNIMDATNAAYLYNNTHSEWLTSKRMDINFNAQNFYSACNNVFYNDKIVFGFDYGNMDGGASAYAGFVPQLTHGTHTTGILAGSDSGSGFYGEAPQAQLMFAKIFTEDFTYGTIYSDDIDIAAAIQDAVTLGVDAINISLGTSFGFTNGSYNSYIFDVCEYARQLGVNIQAAAGNNLVSTYFSERGDYPRADRPDYGSINSPASFESTLSIGSVDNPKFLSTYIDINGEKFNVTDFSYEGYEDTATEYDIYNDIGTANFNFVKVSGNGTREDFEAANVEGKVAVILANSAVSNENLSINASLCGAKGLLISDELYLLETSYTANKKFLPAALMEKTAYEAMPASGTAKLVKAANTASVFSSWGATPELGIGVDVVTVGGNVYSSLPTEAAYRLSNPGLYDYEYNYGFMSGTSMASPRATGKVAKLKSALKKKYPEANAVELQRLTNAFIMSTATTVYDINNNVVSPRKQGAGQINIDNAISSSAYISVDGKNKPRIEIGDDADRTGSYTLNFNIVNTGSTALTYALSADVMTDSVCADTAYNALKPHIFNDADVKYYVTGGTLSGNTVSVAANSTASVAVTLKLTAENKSYIDKYFKNGSYVEGFIHLSSETAADLVVPYLAFYGSWAESPMIDNSRYDEEAYEVAPSYATAVKADGRTNVTLGYYNYYLPTVYDGFYDWGYDASRIAICRGWNGRAEIYSLNRIITSFLRNAQDVTYTIFDKDTGETYAIKEDHFINKTGYAASSGSISPWVQGLTLSSNLPNNAQLIVRVTAKLGYGDNEKATKNSWEFPLYIDNETPMLRRGSTLSVEGDKAYLNVEVFENHMLNCVWFYDAESNSMLDNPTPIYNEQFEGGKLNKLSFEISKYLEMLPEGADKIGIVLEDCVANRVYYTIDLGEYTLSTAEETEEDVYYDDFSVAKSLNVAVSYSESLQVECKEGYVVSYSSSDENVAFVLEDGRVVGKGNGNAVITTTFTNGSDVKTFTTRVHVYTKNDEYRYAYITESNQLDGNVGTYRLTNYYGDGTHVFLPETYNDGVHGEHPVTEIAQYALRSAYYAEYIYVPDCYRSLTGVGYTFAYCSSLKSIRLSPNIEQISGFCFYGCSSLEEVILPEKLVKINNYAFEYTSSLKTIEFQSSLKTIGSYVFANSGLTSLVLPEGIESIGSGIVSGCNEITEISYPDSLTSLSSETLRGLEKLVKVKFPNNPEFKSLPGTAFSGCISLKEITGGEYIESIGNRAFTGCTSLVTLDMRLLFPRLKLIDSNVFEGCTALTYVTLSNPLTEIGDNAFSGCISLKTVDFGEETFIESWGKTVFTGCSKFDTINIGANRNYKVNNGILYQLNGNGREGELLFAAQRSRVSTLNLPVTVTKIWNHAFYENLVLTRLNIPRNSALIEIGENAFAYTKLESIDLSNASQLRTLGAGAFAYIFEGSASTTALSSVNLYGTQLTTIPANAFRECYYLESVALPENLSVISSYSFFGCLRLKDLGYYENGEVIKGSGVVLPSTVSSMGSYCFAQCQSMEKLDMSACRLIKSYWAEYGFFNCIELKEVILPSTLELIYNYTFANCNALEKMNLEETQVYELYSAALAATGFRTLTFPSTMNIVLTNSLGNCENLEELNLNEGLQRIFPGAFSYCTNLKELTIPSTIDYIADNAFAYSGLEVLNLPENLGYYSTTQVNRTYTITGRAFYGCIDLREINIAESNINYGVTDGIFYRKAQGNNADTMLVWPIARQAAELVIPEIFKSIPAQFFWYANGIEKVVIPSHVTSIGYGTFFNSTVKEVEFASDSGIDFTGVYSIFENCLDLEKVTLPDNITVICDSMFYNCPSLKDVNIPETVNTVSAFAFSYCELLTDFDFKNIESIGTMAFYGCTGLTSLYIPETLTNITFSAGEMAFQNCTFDTIVVDSANKAYKSVDNVLYDKLGATLILYPSGKTDEVYKIPHGVARIGEGAFSGNGHLKTVIFPKTVKRIGDAAFLNTENLLTYVFTSEQAPKLEVITQVIEETDDEGNTTRMYLVEYDNFFKTVSEIGEISPLTLYAPENSVGYDDWIFGSFFDEVHPLSESGVDYSYDLSGTTSTDFSVMLPGKEYTDVYDYANDYIDGVLSSLSASNYTAANWTAINDIVLRFKNKLDVFYLEEGVYTEQDVLSELDNVVRSVYAIPNINYDFIVNQWVYISAINSLSAKLSASGVYSADALTAIKNLTQNAMTAISDSADTEEMKIAYDRFADALNTVPKSAGEEAEYAAKKAETVDLLKTVYENGKSSFTGSMLDYYTQVFEEASQEINGCFSFGYLNYLYEKYTAKLGSVGFFNGIRDDAALLAYKEEVKARFDEYKVEDYVYSDYLAIKALIEEAVVKIDSYFTVEDIDTVYSHTVYGYHNDAGINSYEKKIDVERKAQLEQLDYSLWYYQMGNYVSSEYYVLIQIVYDSAVEELNACTDINNLRSIADKAFENIWNIYVGANKAQLAYNKLFNKNLYTREKYLAAEQARNAAQLRSVVVPENYAYFEGLLSGLEFITEAEKEIIDNAKNNAVNYAFATEGLKETDVEIINALIAEYRNAVEGYTYSEFSASGALPQAAADMQDEIKGRIEQIKAGYVNDSSSGSLISSNSENSGKPNKTCGNCKGFTGAELGMLAVILGLFAVVILKKKQSKV